LDAIYVCPHDDGECNCRKPQTGLIEQAFRDFPQAHPQNSIMIGDSLRDIEAGLRFGMATVFIHDAGGDPIEAKRATVLADLTVASLPELVHRYLCPAARSSS
jgi:histidinol phosphatase-like enzyme